MHPRTLAPVVVVLSMATVRCDRPAVAVCDGLEGIGCDDCYGELTRCEFDGVEVTEQSCEGCQARLALLQELCASGSEATVAEVDAGMTCEPAKDTPAAGP